MPDERLGEAVERLRSSLEANHVHYCGVVPAHGLLQLAMLEEIREPEPPIRLAAVFFEPGSARPRSRRS